MTWENDDIHWNCIESYNHCPGCVSEGRHEEHARAVTIIQQFIAWVDDAMWVGRDDPPVKIESVIKAAHAYCEEKP